MVLWISRRQLWTFSVGFLSGHSNWIVDGLLVCSEAVGWWSDVQEDFVLRSVELHAAMVSVLELSQRRDPWFGFQICKNAERH